MTAVAIRRRRPVLEGREPAESLPTLERRALFVSLLGAGLTIRDIAELTRTTGYTVARILDDADRAARRDLDTAELVAYAAVPTTRKAVA